MNFDLRRTLLWGVFVASLVLLWDAWGKHQGLPSMFGPAAVPVAAVPAPAAPVGAAAGSNSDVPAPAVAAATPGTTATPAAASTGTGADHGESVVITTDVVQATLDTQGGSLIKLVLLKHKELVEHTWYEPWLDLLTGKRAEAKEPEPVVLFDRSAQRTYVAESGVIGAVNGAATPTHKTLMTLAEGPRTLADGADSLVVRFDSPSIGGLKLSKIYTFRRGDYAIGVRHEVTNTGTQPVPAQLYLQLVRDASLPPGHSSYYFTFTGAAVFSAEKKFQKVDFASLDKRQPGEAPKHIMAADNGWVAMVQHYFASAWLVDPGPQREFRSAKYPDHNLYAISLVLPLGELAPGATRPLEARLFAGPQEEPRLAALAPGLDLVKDYGWFTVLARPLFWLLNKLHGLIGNWGWAIMALVVLLKIAFFSLNASAYRSQARMKAVNPRLIELRERYKDKPQQMQQEMMRIYKEEKVNPVGGCLPIFVQMPFFIALYWVLLSSVEMRNAPWIGWITDLSAKDPYFILPVLMTGSTLFQTWLNPMPADPTQARMMWIMPLVFSVMFFAFPAGLVLYWLTNNLLSIAQQWLIYRRLGLNNKPGSTAAAIAKPAASSK